MEKQQTGEVGPWHPWWPILLMLGCSLLSYMDRQILAVLSPMILVDLKLSAERYAEILSAFSVAYMIGNPVWGGDPRPHGTAPGHDIRRGDPCIGLCRARDAFRLFRLRGGPPNPWIR